MPPIVFRSDRQRGNTAYFPFHLSLRELVIEARNNSRTIEPLISVKPFLG